MPLISTQTDIGPIVKAILEKPDEWNDTEIPIVGDVLTTPQMAEIYGKVYGVPTRAVFLGEAGGGRLVEMYKTFKDPGYYPSYSGREQQIVEKAKKLYPGLMTWERYLREVGLEYLKEEK